MSRKQDRKPTPFKEFRDNLGRIMPRRGNVTFSIAPEEGLPTLEVHINADGSPSKSPVSSPENDEKIISQVMREEKAIRFHAVNRVDLMLHILIAYYGTGLNVKVMSTVMQHGSCEGTKIQRTFLHACHSSIFPNLYDYRTGDIPESSEWKRTGILHGTAFYDAMNVTVGLPEAANQLDRKLEGNRGKVSAGELYSPYANPSLKIINLVSQGKIGPIEGINQFLALLEKFYVDMESIYVSERTITSPPRARRLIHDYERGAVLFLKGKSQRFVRRDYIEMLLGITNANPVRILSDEKVLKSQILYLEPVDHKSEHPTEIKYRIKTEREIIYASIKKGELQPSQLFDSLVKLLKTPIKNERRGDPEIPYEYQGPILSITQSRKHTQPSEKEQLRQYPELRGQIYRQKYEKIAREILGDKYSSIPRKMPLKEILNEEVEIPVKNKEEKYKEKKSTATEIAQPNLIKTVTLLSILTAYRDQLIQESLPQNGVKIEEIEELIINVNDEMMRQRTTQDKELSQFPAESFVTPKKTKEKLSLTDYVAQWGYTCHNVPPDGSCFFHSILDQLRRYSPQLVNDEDTYISLRASAIDYLLQHPPEFSGSITGSVHTFILNAMSQMEWADHQLVHALVQAKRLTIVFLRSDNTINIFRHPSALAIVYLAYDIGLHYQSLVRSAPLPVHHRLNQLIAQSPIGEWRLYSAVTPLPAQPIPPASAPVPYRARKKTNKNKPITPATAPKADSKLFRSSTAPVELESPLIRHLTRISDSKQIVFEKLPWRFSSKQVYANQYYMGVVHGDSIIQELKSIRRMSLELLLAQPLSRITSEVFTQKEWIVVALILDYAEDAYQNYLRSLVLGEIKLETLTTAVNLPSEKLPPIETDSHFFNGILKIIQYTKVIFEKLPTRYSNIDSGYSSPYYLGAPIGDNIVRQLSEINQICLGFTRQLNERLPLIAALVGIIFFGSDLEWGLVDIILEYLEHDPTHDAEMLEKQLGIAYEAFEEEKVMINEEPKVISLPPLFIDTSIPPLELPSKDDIFVTPVKRKISAEERLQQLSRTLYQHIQNNDSQALADFLLEVKDEKTIAQLVDGGGRPFAIIDTPLEVAAILATNTDKRSQNNAVAVIKLLLRYKANPNKAQFRQYLAQLPLSLKQEIETLIQPVSARFELGVSDESPRQRILNSPPSRGLFLSPSALIPLVESKEVKDPDNNMTRIKRSQSWPSFFNSRGLTASTKTPKSAIVKSDIAFRT